MKLTELLAGVGTEPVASSRTKLDVLGLTADSRQVKAGDLFFAVPGTKADGSVFAAEAASRGAIAIITEREVQGVAVPVFKVASVRKALALVAGNFYGNPARERGLGPVRGRAQIILKMKARISQGFFK